MALTHSVSAGLDYALVGPEHSWLRDQGRTEYVSVTDREALDAARTLARTEGIIPALESAHAVSEALRRAPAAKGELYVINLSGRGDKDTDIYRENLKEVDDSPANQTRSAGSLNASAPRVDRRSLPTSLRAIHRPTKRRL